MNELRHQINSQLKASGVSHGIHYKSFQNQQLGADPLNKGSYKSSTKQSSKNMGLLKSGKIGVNSKKRTEASDQHLSSVLQTNESLQMKINKKRIQSSNKHSTTEGPSQQLTQPSVSGHHRIVSNPINFNHENLAQAQQQIVNKSRKNLSSQQSQSKLRAFENQSESNANPTQQILKLRAQALVPPQSMMVKNNEKDIQTTTQVTFPTQGPLKIQKREQRANQQKMAQIIAMEQNNNLNNHQLAQQIMLGGLNTINNDINSRQEVHEHNIGNPVGPNKKGNHNKAFSMSTYVLQKQIPKTQQVVPQEPRITTSKMKQSQGTNMTMHQKSQSTFNGQGMQQQNTYDARKTFHNNMTVNSQAFSNSSMAKLIQSSHTVSNMTQKKKVIKGNQQLYLQGGYQPQNQNNTVGGQIPHNLHRRIMSQQNPNQEQSQGNIDQYINQQQEIQNQANLGSSGKIVVINNNNTNINIHHQSPYQGVPTQYPQMVKQQQVIHKKNTQSFQLPLSHNQIRTPGQQNESGHGVKNFKGGKVYTYVNSTIKNSINNSLNQGLLSHEHLQPSFAINNYVGEDEIKSHKQMSPDEKHNNIPKSQKTFSKLTKSSNAPSVYSNGTNQRKKQVKIGETRIVGSSGVGSGQGTAQTNPSVVSGGIPTQASNTNIKFAVQSQIQLSQKQKQLYNQTGGITSVGSASSIGDKIERIDDQQIRGKTRQPSQNKSATRGKSGSMVTKEIIEPRTFNQNSSSQMKKTVKQINSQKQQSQVQMHQGDISSSNFLNSERSSLNKQKISNHIQQVPHSNAQSTIQYHKTQAQQNNYLQQFHNTEENRRPQNVISDQSITQHQNTQQNTRKQTAEHPNSFSQDMLTQTNQLKAKNQQNFQVQDSYFNVVNNSIIKTQGATRGISHQKVTSAGNSRDPNPSNGQKTLQKLLNQNINKLSPSQQYKNTNIKQTSTTKSHQRGLSVNIPTNQIKPASNTNKNSKKIMGHRKVESHDQAVLEQMKNNQSQYYVQKKGPSQSDVQSYSQFEKFSNSENIRSEKRYQQSGKEEKGLTQQSQMSNRHKVIPNIDLTVPVSEISLQGTIVETMQSELKQTPKIMGSPMKQHFPGSNSSQKKVSPSQKITSGFHKKTVISSESNVMKNFESPKSKQKNMLNSGSLTPKKLIYNSILANIKENIFETKIDYYKIGKVIGKGAFGKVNLAIHRLTGKFVALKSINKTFMKDESSLKKVRQEYNILKRARHPNIVRLYESFETESHIVYVMEVCGGGDLLTYVRRRRKLKEEYAKFIFTQIIKGLQYVHHKGVLHRDIKLDNILLTSEGDVKICDFGVSKLVPNKNQTQTEQCGTPAYIAPEVFRGKGYKGFQSDVWSAGVVLYAMLFGTVPFKATNMHELQAQIINLQCSWGQPNEISNDALTMLKKVLEVDPNKRLTPQEILMEPWMQLTDKQLEEIQVFNESEIEKIVQEFLYYNEKQEDMKDDPFLEQELQTTQNSDFKNNTTKSIILAPFNSTRSHISDDYLINEGILPLIVNKENFEFADKCKEVNRQYMLNNNAELDNGVYNENEEEEQKALEEAERLKEQKRKEDDGLLGMNMQIENQSPSVIVKSGSPSQGRSKFESQQMTAIQSLNTSQLILDEDKIDKVCDLYCYEFDYVKEQLESDELNHATTCYFLIDQGKEF